jgi:hypothetical protein
MLTVQALREIYKSLGGTETDITDNMTIPEALAKIATAVATIATAATTKELPAYSATENGKVLKVADGALTWGTDEIQA